MLDRKPSFLRTLPVLLLIALFAACSRAPESEQSVETQPADNNTEVVVIVKTEEPPVALQPEEVLVEFPTDDGLLRTGGGHGGIGHYAEDPNEAPNDDFVEDPSYGWSGNESPYPNRSGPSSVIGLAGGAGSGGGRGAAGGFAHRRARGGGGRPHDDRLRAGLEWLKDHQNADGHWSAVDFRKDTARTSATQSNTTAGTESDTLDTGLALLSFTGAGYDHKEGDYRATVRSALLYLRKIQEVDGYMGRPENPKLPGRQTDMASHAAATAAVAEAYGLSGDAVLKPIVDRAVDYIVKMQFKDSGWGTDDANLSHTAWALAALKVADSAGLSFGFEGCCRQAAKFLAAVLGQDPDDGGYYARYSLLVPKQPVKDAPDLPREQALWMVSALNTSRYNQSSPEIIAFAKQLLEPDALPQWKAGSIDFLYWYWVGQAMYQMGASSWNAFEKPLARALLDNQRGYTSADKGASKSTLDEHGSWDPEDGRGGRVFATVLNTLNVGVYERYQRVVQTVKTDSDKDGLADLPDMDGFVRSQSATSRSNCGVLVARNGTSVVGEFPLRHTDVRAKVSGTLAGTTVTQTFTNPYNTAIEALYTFPLPTDSAINDFVMQVGERRVIGVIRSREEAVKVYREAKARGYTASLLTQNRPNVFTQNVANIESSGEVKVKITYYQRLEYRDGRFEYMFPMTLGPRFKPGESNQYDVEPQPEPEPEPVPEPEPGMDRDGLDDAEDYDDHVLPPGMRSGMDIDLTVEIDAGMPIDVTRLRSLAHEVLLEMTNEGRAVVTLNKLDAVPNRDFVLRWGIAGIAPEVGLLTHSDARGNYLSLQIQPQLDPADTDITPREITFILDNSGSMSGTPSQMSKQVIRKTLDHLHPDDKFNIVYFAGSNAQLFETPADNTSDNVSSARDFLGKTKAGGGTMMLPALQRALNMEHDPQHLQVFAFLTDGFIGNEQQILRMIREEGRDARFFALGIGSSVNRGLIDGIAEQGNGKAIYCLPRDGGYDEGAVEEFYGAIDRPVLCDIDIDWNGLEVHEAYPSKFNDLFASQPLSLQARYGGSGKHTIYVRGRVGARYVEYPVELDLGENQNNPAIASIWARSKIHEMEGRLLSDQTDTVLQSEILKTALEYRLMSSQTSFVAVDESRVVGDGRPMQVWQPNEMPEGVTFMGDDVAAENSKTFRIQQWGLWVGQTADGRVIVVKVEDGGAAANASMQPGQILEKINGIAVTNLNALEKVLLQAVAKVEVETSLTDNGQRIESDFKLPEIKPTK